ncbi:MAG: tRNA (adenosine(37)-N6)-dimethylallyltransferase MiaA [Gemmatimonadales bacterium]|nr:tRNA (adenosine(37)-N6)-dimethylallyltransferase MiaA [Gemmatimonadales bacterium]
MAAAETLLLVGPTASGKSAVALALAERRPVELVCADSRTVYRGLDIGTAKPTRRERERVPHHGLDLIRPGERFSAGRFAELAAGWLGAIRARGAEPVVVGGTGLYLRALVDGLFHEPPLDPERRRRLDAFTARLEPLELARWARRLDATFAGGGRQRAARAIEIALLTGRPLSWWQVAARRAGAVRPFTVRLTLPRALLHERIRRRAEAMVRGGLLEEAAAALADGAAPGAPGLDGVGYREAVAVLTGEAPREGLVDAIATSTRQYAKRQETWFRHQLGGPGFALDAARPPEQLADEILRAWDARATARGTA